ncbi:MAG: trehalose-phosphatase [Alphaproteobacteria bacterium]|nr:trehalose-phosphatase [Alphaproteobacteria bacterium]
MPNLAADAISLFLDLDGTLAAFAPRPEDVGPDAARNGVLRAVSDRLDGRVAIVSGRAIADVDRITGGAIAAVAGSHGLERRDAHGRVTRRAPHPALAEALALAERFAADRQGVRVERKPASFALHFRAAPELSATVQGFASDMARAKGLRVVQGAMVSELKTPGPNKGDAVRAFMQEAPFLGRAPVFLGDDITDEDAFIAVNALEGVSILVGPARETAARARLDDPDAVLAWLREIGRQA